MTNNIQKMRTSNSKARALLKKAGFDNIHLVPHTRWSKDIVVDGAGFDGLCTNACTMFFLQIKTNAWPQRDPYMSFVRVYGIPVLLINVRQKDVGMEVIMFRGNEVVCEEVKTLGGLRWVKVCV